MSSIIDRLIGIFNLIITVAAFESSTLKFLCLLFNFQYDWVPSQEGMMVNSSTMQAVTQHLCLCCDVFVIGLSTDPLKATWYRERGRGGGHVSLLCHQCFSLDSPPRTVSHFSPHCCVVTLVSNKQRQLQQSSGSPRW